MDTAGDWSQHSRTKKWRDRGSLLRSLVERSDAELFPLLVGLAKMDVEKNGADLPWVDFIIHIVTGAMRKIGWGMIRDVPGFGPYREFTTRHLRLFLRTSGFWRGKEL